MLILLVIFFHIFGETCPNSILRAERDAALSLARRVFEFFNESLIVTVWLGLLGRINLVQH